MNIKLYVSLFLRHFLDFISFWNKTEKVLYNRVLHGQYFSCLNQMIYFVYVHRPIKYRICFADDYDWQFLTVSYSIRELNQCASSTQVNITNPSDTEFAPNSRALKILVCFMFTHTYEIQNRSLVSSSINPLTGIPNI